MTKRDTRKVFTLRIEMDNDAFKDEPELVLEEMLTEAGHQITGGDTTGKVYDANGNKVGEWIIAEHPVTR